MLVWSPPHILDLWLRRARALFALVQISASASSHCKCSVKVMPKYLYWLESAILSFLNVKAWLDLGLFPLFFLKCIILVLDMLRVIFHLSHHCSTTFISFSSLFSSGAKSTMSSAYSRLDIMHSLHSIPPCTEFRLSTKSSINIAKRVGDSMHPCYSLQTSPRVHYLHLLCSSLCCTTL